MGRAPIFLIMPDYMPVFIDRRDAGRQLASRLKALDLAEPVVYALPRGGVPVAVEIARALKAPIDLVLVRKIGAPGQPELALAAVVDGEDAQTVVNEAVGGMTGGDAAYLEKARAPRARRDRATARALFRRAPAASAPPAAPRSWSTTGWLPAPRPRPRCAR